jgi:phosphoserine phosphatase RsbU/P
MTDDKLKAFESVILQHLQELLTLADSKTDKSKLQLHGTTMDDILKSVSELKHVLEKIRDKSFGACVICSNGEEVELDRLEHDYTTSICLSHYSEDQLRSLERDLELTAKIQHDLLPCTAPLTDKFEFAHFSKPAGIVSGDYYDFFEFADNKQGLVIADVMGKGISASMLMANIQATLRTLGPQSDNIEELITRINKLFSFNMKMIRFLSLFTISLDISSGKIEYCNAGHNPPIFWNDKEKKTELLSPTGPAIGLMKDSVYKTKHLKLLSNDLILLYTDGLSEARNSKGDEFGEERLTEFVKTYNRESAENFLDILRKSINAFASDFHDDITIVVLKVR